MSGFFFVPSIPVLPEFSPGNTAVKKGETKSGDDFGAFLDAYFKNVASFATPLSFPVSKSCGSCSSAGEESTSLSCPLSSTPSATSLSCPSIGESSTTQAPTELPSLQEFPTLFSDLLEMVENFSVTLRLEGGNVTVSGARSEDGVFAFSVEGKKEALVEFFTLLLENLKDWMANEPQATSQCGKIQCGRILEDGDDEVVDGCSLMDASASKPQETEEAIGAPVEDEVINSGEEVVDAPVEVLPPEGEGEPGSEILTEDEVVPSELS
ncbi:MAG: hypothetical protein H5U36_08240, partial [Candidatus Caldatribacterium sp.]|nr:hypothetical protein [Candidatus Caldatribacterium sp.]